MWERRSLALLVRQQPRTLVYVPIAIVQGKPSQQGKPKTFWLRIDRRKPPQSSPPRLRWPARLPLAWRVSCLLDPRRGNVAQSASAPAVPGGRCPRLSKIEPIAVSDQATRVASKVRARLVTYFGREQCDINVAMMEINDDWPLLERER